MNIAANRKKAKGRKKSPRQDQAKDPMKELRSIIEGEMARRETKPSKKAASKAAAKAKAAAPAPTPPAAALKAAAPASVQPAKPLSKKQDSMTPSANDVPALEAPDFTQMTAQIMKIAARSQKILNAFLDRNKTLIEKMPSIDPAHLGDAFNDFVNKTLNKPELVVEANIAFWQDYVHLLQASVAKASGQEVEPIIEAEKGDRRFKDKEWQEHWLFDFIKQSYLLFARWVENLVDVAESMDFDPKLAHKLSFYTKQMVDAVSPSNFWMTNPEVLRTTLETGGENLLNGLENLLDDMERGQGQLLISMSDNSAFHFGENIASSKGKVVYQNELIQLIQFAPLTETQHKTPLLIVPPWINKYYILDLKPENSFIRYLNEQGHTVYCISWVNPDQRHAKLGFDDYMTLGPIAAMREVAKATGEKEINCIGYCIGGTLLACTLAWMAGLGAKKPKDVPDVISATYLVTLIDFSEPGDLGVFIDEDQISMIEAMMEGPGYLPAPLMSTTFSMLRANDLIWSFVVNNYLMGREPFPFDLLTWNSDSTNLPAAMQSYYLRNMYLHNNLIKPNALTMKDVPIDLRKIKVPTFCLSTHDDHITPWRSTYAATQTYSGPVTFCLSGSGHIAGVVNPPVKEKYGYWINRDCGGDTNKRCPADPNEWLSACEQNKGSWWPEWIKWLDRYAGPMVPARDPAANENATEDAPGSYVGVRVM